MPPNRKFQFGSLMDFPTAVGLCLVEGVDNFTARGLSNVLALDIETDITSIPDTELDTSKAGFATVYYPDNDGEAMEVVSDDPTDTGNIEIYALGPGGVLLPPFSITLTGVTPVALPDPNLYSRINFMRNFSIVGYAGTITIRPVGGGNTFANMIEHHQQMSQARYTIPDGKKGLVKKAVGSMRKQGGTDTAIAILVQIKPFTFDKFYHPFGFGLQRSGTTTVSLVNEYPSAIDGPFDIKISANAASAGAEAAASVVGLTID